MNHHLHHPRTRRFRRSAQPVHIEPLERRTLMSFGPLGPTLSVNTTTARDQTAPVVAADADGDFVIAWASNEQDGSGSGVYARRYSAAGMPLGGEFLVNTTTAGDQWDPAVAIDASGDFVIAWIGQDASGREIYAQCYSDAGERLGGEVVVNTATAGDEDWPAVAMDADGDFVVAWESYGPDGLGLGVFARRFSAAGMPLGEEFLVSSGTETGRITMPAVAVDADGDFVVAWDQGGAVDYEVWWGTDGSVTVIARGVFHDVYARRYDATGQPAGAEFCVQESASLDHAVPAVAVDADGDFVVAWQVWSPIYNCIDCGVYAMAGINARRFDAAGVAQGEWFSVSETVDSPDVGASVAMDADGDFAIAWQGSTQAPAGPMSVVNVLCYDASGVARGSAFRVASTGGSPQHPAIAMRPDGDFVVAWNDGGLTGNDVFSQRYSESAPPLPLITGDDVAVTEGTGATASAVFTVTLSAPAEQRVTVDYFTSHDAYRVAGEYEDSSGTLTFDPGETVKTISIPVITDARDEYDEVFALNLASPVNAELADGQAIATILDDDAPPSITIGDAAVTEGNIGFVWLTLEVRLSAWSEKDVSVAFATTDGTARAGSDYAAASGTLIFAPGQSVKTIRIQVLADTRRESNEMFLINLTSPLNATLADALGIGTILNDDGR